MLLDNVNGRREQPLLLAQGQGENVTPNYCGHRCHIIPPHMIREQLTYFQHHIEKYHEDLVAKHREIKRDIKQRLQSLDQGMGLVTESREELQRQIDKAKSIIAKAKNAPAMLESLRHQAEADLAHRQHRLGLHQHAAAAAPVERSVPDVIDAIEQAPVLRELSDLFSRALGRIKGRTSDSSSSSSTPPLKPGVEVRIFNLQEGDNLTRGTRPGKEVYSNLKTWDATKIEEAAQKAFDNTLNVLRFWKEKFGLDSFDDHNHEIDAVIHYLKNYANAFFDGERMVYGDGNFFFDAFVNYLDVAGHEMWHAVTPFEYQGESGALNEHYSDVFGAGANMFVTKTTVHDYHWLVGKDLVKYKVKGVEHRAALRSFINPGTAYANVKGLGSDPQPATYDKRDTGSDDNGGVHINSGIANNAFYRICMQLGETDKPMMLWFNLLRRTDLVSNKPTFTEFANGLIKLATEQKDQQLVDALVNAWTAVKVPFTAPHHAMTAAAPAQSEELVAAIV